MATLKGTPGHQSSLQTQNHNMKAQSQLTSAVVGPNGARLPRERDRDNIMNDGWNDGWSKPTMKSNRQMLLEKMTKNMPLLPNEVGNGNQHGGMLPVGVRQINPKPSNQEHGEGAASDS